MAQMATQARFEGGAWYENYGRLEDGVWVGAGPAGAAARLPWVLAQAPATGKLAVAGCGWGFLVKALRESSRDAYGFDAASYATLKYATIDPGFAARVVTANVTNATQMTNFRRNNVGLSGSTKIPLIVTDDMLSSLTDAEVTTALAQLRANATKVIHVITCARPDTVNPANPLASDVAQRSADFVWRSHQGWKTRIGNSELVMNTEGGAVL